MPIRPAEVPPWQRILAQSAETTGQTFRIIGDTLSEQRRQRLANDRAKIDMLENAYQFGEQKRIDDLKVKKLELEIENFSKDDALERSNREADLSGKLTRELATKAALYQNTILKPLQEQAEALALNPYKQDEYNQKLKEYNEASRIFAENFAPAVNSIDPLDPPEVADQKIKEGSKKAISEVQKVISQPEPEVVSKGKQPIDLPSGQGSISDQLFPGTERDDNNFNFGPSVTPSGPVNILPVNEVQPAPEQVIVGATTFPDGSVTGFTEDPIESGGSDFGVQTGVNLAALVSGIGVTEPKVNVDQELQKVNTILDRAARLGLSEAKMNQKEAEMSQYLDSALGKEGNPWRKEVIEQIEDAYNIDTEVGEGFRSRIEERAINILGPTEARQRILNAARLKGDEIQARRNQDDVSPKTLEDIRNERNSLSVELARVDERVSKAREDTERGLVDGDNFSIDDYNFLLERQKNIRRGLSEVQERIDNFGKDIQAESVESTIDAAIGATPNEVGFGGGIGSPRITDNNPGVLTGEGLDPRSDLSKAVDNADRNFTPDLRTDKDKVDTDVADRINKRFGLNLTGDDLPNINRKGLQKTILNEIGKKLGKIWDTKKEVEKKQLSQSFQTAGENSRAAVGFASPVSVIPSNIEETDKEIFVRLGINSLRAEIAQFAAIEAGFTKQLLEDNAETSLKSIRTEALKSLNE